MALIKCKECGKKISDTVEVCPHCGITLDESICPKCKNEIDKDKDEFCSHCGYQLKKEKNNKKINFLNKKLIIIVVIILLISISIFLVKKNSFTMGEKYALNCTERLIDAMKNPDSFKLQDDILFIDYVDPNSSNNEIYIFTYIDYTAENSYGGTVRSTAVYEGYTYIGELEDFDNMERDDENYTVALHSRIAYLERGLYGDSENLSSEIVSAKKIASKLHIDYNKK